MKGEQVFFLAVTFAVILGIAGLAQLKWLPGGKWKFAIVFLAGLIAVASLRIAGLPPDWFAGSKTGFGLAVSLLIGAMVGSSNSEEKTFRMPLLLGMGLTLLVANLVQVVSDGL